MNCEHARCTDTATVKTRFGQGFYKAGGLITRQSFVHYCEPHYRLVDRLFVLFDVRVCA